MLKDIGCEKELIEQIKECYEKEGGNSYADECECK